MRSTLEINDQFKRALELIENTSKNVFITGKAGTGKSTLLEYFRANTKKEVVVLAPTGVAALNVKGQTIHSFFGFKPDITLNKIKKIKFTRDKPNIFLKIDIIVIDEISMVRADLLDCVDKFLRLNGPSGRQAFGGIQMVFIGDLYQLPPVVTGREKQIFKEHYPSPYFFDAQVFESFQMEYLELEKVYRQKDEKFIALLNSIRNNSAGEAELAALNKRYDPSYEPRSDFSVILTSTNQMAADINQQRLNSLKGKERVFSGELEGEFEAYQLPTEAALRLKKGAQVMMLNNDGRGRWVNGSMGKVAGFDEEEIVVKLADGEEVWVSPFTWEVFNYEFDRRSGRIETDVVGAFTQYPLKLAWAITIHKSQGKTFDRVAIDIGKGTFAHGQMYVALSRCRTLQGMVLKKPIKKSHIFMDWRVVKFVTRFQYQKSEEDCPFEDKVVMITRAIESKADIEITYLKAADVKSRRIITPLEVGEMEYNGKPFVGLRAFCKMRGEERVFRVDRVLEMKTRS
ncbi:MAG: AAA family ATPase [Candidatus Margulisbacteria bacterium]|nr:AAA family ATPase [Candidatus Margulisiibacteriota bacterium]